MLRKLYEIVHQRVFVLTNTKFVPLGVPRMPGWLLPATLPLNRAVSLANTRTFLPD